MSLVSELRAKYDISDDYNDEEVIYFAHRDIPEYQSLDYDSFRSYAMQEPDPDSGQGAGADFVDMFQSGAWRTGGDLLDLFGADDLAAWMYQRAEQNETLVSEMQKVADQKKFIEVDEFGDWSFGDAWADPRAIMGVLARSGAGTIASIVPGLGATKALQVGAGLSKVAAGALGFGATEGLVGGASIGKAVEDEILRMTEAELSEQSGYLDLLYSGMEPEEAKKEYARRMQMVAGAAGTVATGGLGAPMGALYGKMFGGDTVFKNYGTAFLGGAAGEMVQEGSQTAAEGVVQDVSLGRDVEFDPNEIVTGMIAGGAMGGPFAALGHAFRTEADAAQKEVDNILNNPPPEPEPEATPEGAALDEAEGLDEDVRARIEEAAAEARALYMETPDEQIVQLAEIQILMDQGHTLQEARKILADAIGRETAAQAARAYQQREREARRAEEEEYARIDEEFEAGAAAQAQEQKDLEAQKPIRTKEGKPFQRRGQALLVAARMKKENPGREYEVEEADGGFQVRWVPDNELIDREITRRAEAGRAGEEAIKGITYASERQEEELQRARKERAEALEMERMRRIEEKQRALEGGRETLIYGPRDPLTPEMMGELAERSMGPKGSVSDWLKGFQNAEATPDGAILVPAGDTSADASTEELAEAHQRTVNAIAELPAGEERDAAVQLLDQIDEELASRGAAPEEVVITPAAPAAEKKGKGTKDTKKKFPVKGKKKEEKPEETQEVTTPAPAKPAPTAPAAAPAAEVTALETEEGMTLEEAQAYADDIAARRKDGKATPEEKEWRQKFLFRRNDTDWPRPPKKGAKPAAAPAAKAAPAAATPTAPAPVAEEATTEAPPVEETPTEPTEAEKELEAKTKEVEEAHAATIAAAEDRVKRQMATDHDRALADPDFRPKKAKDLLTQQYSGKYGVMEAYREARAKLFDAVEQGKLKPGVLLATNNSYGNKLWEKVLSKKVPRLKDVEAAWEATLQELVRVNEYLVKAEAAKPRAEPKPAQAPQKAESQPTTAPAEEAAAAPPAAPEPTSDQEVKAADRLPEADRQMAERLGIDTDSPVTIGNVQYMPGDTVQIELERVAQYSTSDSKGGTHNHKYQIIGQFSDGSQRIVIRKGKGKAKTDYFIDPDGNTAYSKTGKAKYQVNNTLGIDTAPVVAKAAPAPAPQETVTPEPAKPKAAKKTKGKKAAPKKAEPEKKAPTKKTTPAITQVQSEIAEGVVRDSDLVTGTETRSSEGGPVIDTPLDYQYYNDYFSALAEKLENGTITEEERNWLGQFLDQTAEEWNPPPLLTPERIESTLVTIFPDKYPSSLLKEYDPDNALTPYEARARKNAGRAIKDLEPSRGRRTEKDTDNPMIERRKDLLARQGELNEEEQQELNDLTAFLYDDEVFDSDSSNLDSVGFKLQSAGNWVSTNGRYLVQRRGKKWVLVDKQLKRTTPGFARRQDAFDEVNRRRADPKAMPDDASYDGEIILDPTTGRPWQNRMGAAKARAAITDKSYKVRKTAQHTYVIAREDADLGYFGGDLDSAAEGVDEAGLSNELEPEEQGQKLPALAQGSARKWGTGLPKAQGDALNAYFADGQEYGFWKLNAPGGNGIVLVEDYGQNRTYAVDRKGLARPATPEEERFLFNNKRAALGGDTTFVEELQAETISIAADAVEKLRKKFGKNRIRARIPLTETRGTERLTVEQAEAAAAEATEGWVQSPVVVVPDAASLPAGMLERLNKRRGRDVSGSVNAIFDPSTGTVYIVAGNVSSTDDVRAIIVHELIGHGGLRRILRNMGSKAAKSILKSAVEAYPEAAALIAEKYGLDLNNETDVLEVGEEVISYMTERTDMSDTLMDRVISFVMQWVRKVAPNLKMSETELRGLIGRMRIATKNGYGSAVVNGEVELLERTFWSEEFYLSVGLGARNEMSRMQQVRYQLQDRFDPLRRMQKRIEQAMGRMLTSKENVYKTEELWTSRAQQRLNVLDERFVEPIIKALRALGDQDLTLRINGKDVEITDSLGLAEAYLHARHAKEANQVLRQRGATAANPAGMSDAEADAILAQFGSDPNLQQIGTMSDALGTHVLDVIEASGLESKANVDILRQAYKHYVPLLRKGFLPGVGPGASRAEGFSMFGTPFKIRAGSERDVDNVLSNLIEQARNAVIQSEKQQVGRALLEMARAFPESSLWEIGKNRYTPKLRADGTLVYKINNIPKDDQIVVREDGVQYTITFTGYGHDENVTAIVNQLKNKDAGKLVSPTLMKVMRFLSSVNTSWNPEFVISNLARDVQTAMINSLSLGMENQTSGQQMKKVGTQIMRMTPKVIKAIWNFERSPDKYTPKPGEAEWVDWVRKFEAAGGKTGWIDHLENIEERANEIRKRAADPNFFRKNFEAMMKSVNDANSAVENSARVIVFRYAYENYVQQGNTPEDAARLAASDAKNITVNFNRRGASGPFLNQLFLFYNASVQGSVRMLQTLRRNPKAFTAVATAMIGVAMMNDILQRAIAPEDDDGMNEYDKLDDSLKARNFIIMLPSGGHVKVPLPWGYNVFHILGQVLGTAMTGEVGTKDIPKQTWRLVGGMLEAFNPMQGADWAQTISPTLTDPILMIATNKAWHGGPLMPENSGYAVPRPDHQRYWSSASWMAKGIAEALNTLSFGDKVDPGFIDISPETIELWWETATGGVGRTVANTLDLIAEPFDDEEWSVSKTPFLRKVLGEPNEYYDAKTFYERTMEVAVAKKQMDVYATDKEKVATLREKKGPLLGLVPLARSTKGKLSKLNEQRRNIENNQNITPERKQEMLDNLDESKDRLYKQFNKAYNNRVLGMDKPTEKPKKEFPTKGKTVSTLRRPSALEPPQHMIPMPGEDSAMIDGLFDHFKSVEGVRYKVYNDDAGYPTIGVGHKLEPGDKRLFQSLFGDDIDYQGIVEGRVALNDKQVQLLLEHDVIEHMAKVRKRIPRYDILPDDVQLAILDGFYRGDLSGSPKTIGLINQGNWRQASVEYLNHREYKERKARGGDGVTRRMETNAERLKRMI